MRVRDVMTFPVRTIGPDATVQELLALWREHPVGGFPVVEQDVVVGLVSESDLVYRDRPLKPPAILALFDALIPLDVPGHFREELRRTVGARVRDVMTSPAITVGPEAEISEAASLMIAKRVDQLPVVDATGKLVGILSRSDLVKTLR